MSRYVNMYSRYIEQVYLNVYKRYIFFTRQIYLDIYIYMSVTLWGTT